MNEMKLRFFTKDESFPFFIQYGKHNEDLIMHTHQDFSELVIVIDGSATHIVDNERFYIQKGDVFVISNDTSHGYEKTDNFRICNIMYQPDSILLGNYDIVKSIGFHALFVLEPYFTKEHSFTSQLKLNAAEFDKVKTITDLMLEEYERKADGWQTLIKSNFMTLVVTLSRLYHYDNNSKSSDIINIAKAVSYIENHFTEDVSTDTLAKLASYSPRHFTRVFHKTYHTTPIDYILSLRIQHACSLLKESRLSVSNIALQCGFNDNNYFSRVFKKRIGISPKQFRSGE